MTDAKYIIFGVEVGDELNTIEFDSAGKGTIFALDKNKVPTTTVMATTSASPRLYGIVGDGPLNVETVGRMMVALSEDQRRTPKLEEDCEIVAKHALKVKEKPKPKDLDAAAKAAILQDTILDVVFETRKKNPSTPDKNTRLLTIPVDGTLKEGEDNAGNFTGGELPPLSYDLDRFLMLAHLQSRIKNLIDDFDGSAYPDWATTILPQLQLHAQKWIADYNQSHGNAEFDAIMKEPKRAYHRAVGIYGTNMCR